MAVAAMGRGDDVAVGELRTDADRGGFLSRVEVDETGNLAGGEFVVDAILEAPDRRHAAIALEEKLSAVLHGSSRSKTSFCSRTDERSYMRTARPPTVFRRNASAPVQLRSSDVQRRFCL